MMLMGIDSTTNKIVVFITQSFELFYNLSNTQ